jgi:DNA-binding NarL/FixJ family response regulator
VTDYRTPITEYRTPVTMPSTRVLILAADPLARAGLAALLAGQERLVVAGLASDRESLPILLDAYRPDVLLWDLGWDPAARLEALDAAAADAPPIVALLGEGGAGGATPGNAAPVWAAGARGVLPRDIAAEALVAALAAAAQGLGVFQPAPAGDLPPGLPPASRLDAQPPLEPLTPRELEVLRAMADGLSNKLIARQLGISEHTVKFHANAILGKLGAQSRTEAVVRATRAGLLLL